MRAICSKFGIADGDPEVGAEVGAREGVRGTVLTGGTGVEVCVAEGIGDGVTVGAAIGVQAVNKTSRTKKRKPFIKPPRAALGVSYDHEREITQLEFDP